MSGEDWRAVRALFDDVAELPLALQRRAVEEASGYNDATRAAVLKLLGVLTERGHTLQAAKVAPDLLSALATDAHEEAVSALIGKQVGAWRVQRELGSGGMGTVYLATRVTAEFSQNGALKLLRHGGVASVSTRRRMAAERQVLAQLSHPNIARLLDGGATDDGLPYLVLEYVDGIPIDAFCKQHVLSLRRRVELVRTLAEAIASAHRALVIHRDVKPSNILVDATGAPKLLDFGIAKITGNRLDETGTVERSGLLTPRYASPEQIRGEPVTTGTDIYSLGVLLYELVVAQSPYHPLPEDALAMVRVIDTRDITAPSNVARRTRPALGVQTRELNQDLDAIVMKMLRRDPAQRYLTMDAVVDDLTNYLERRPVSARKGSALYALRKTVERHKTWAAIAATATFLGIGTALMWRTQREEALRLAQMAELAAQNATQQELRARTTADYVKSILNAADPLVAQGRDTTLIRDLLRQAETRATTELDTQPSVRSEILATIGQTYLGVGDPAEAYRILAPLYYAQSPAGQSGELEMQIALAIANTLSSLGDLPAAERIAARLVERARQESDESMLLRAMAASVKFMSDQGLVDGAITAGERFVRERNWQNGRYLATLKLRLSEAYAQKRDLRAIQYARDAQSLLAGSGDAVDIDAKRLAADSALAYAQFLMQDYRGAALSYRMATARSAELYGKEHVQTLTLRGNLVAALSQDDPAGAITELRDIVRLNDKLRGELHPKSISTLGNLGAILLKTKAYQEARQVLREVRRRCQEAQMEASATCIERAIGLGKAEMALDAVSAAIPLWLDAWARMPTSPSVKGFHDRKALALSIAGAFEQQGHSRKAIEWRQRASE